MAKVIHGYDTIGWTVSGWDPQFDSLTEVELWEMAVHHAVHQKLEPPPRVHEHSVRIVRIHDQGEICPLCPPALPPAPPQPAPPREAGP